MQLAPCLCVCALIVAAVLVPSADSRKTFSTRRKSGGSRRGGSTNFKPKQPPAPVPATPHKGESTNTNFLNSERAGSSHGSGNVHHRGDPFNPKPSAPEAPKQHAPQTNGPIGFEGVSNHGNQKLGFDKVNSEFQQRPAGINAPAYPAGAPAYPGGGLSGPGKPMASAPNGPPPAYPGYGPAGAGTQGGFEPPPAYPGRPVNAPPVYSPNNPSYGQRNPAPPVGGYPNQGGFPNQQNAYQPGGFPNQHGAYPGQSYPGQQSFGNMNNAGGFGSYPSQGYNQGFGSHQPGFGNSYPGGYGQPYPGGFGQSYPGGFGQSYPGGFGGNSYGGSPFGQSNSPFSSNGFGGGLFGGFGKHNSHYSSNNFGFSSNPGFSGSNSFNPGYSGYGYHKKSRFGGLPLPIPIPIPIPMGMFGGFGGGRSYNHRVLDSFVQNKTINSSDNSTSIFILNNSTVTPCTTDQFIYDSLNVTVMSCTAGNCTAIKVFVTTNSSEDTSTYSAGITMCVEANTTYSSFADNVNPTVSDLHKYWIRLYKDDIGSNSTANVTDQASGNVTVDASELAMNETSIADVNATTDSNLPQSTSSPSTEATTLSSENATISTTLSNSTESSTTINNITGTTNTADYEDFLCSWIKMCLPSIEVVDRCATPSTECASKKTGYQPCLILRMCKSPSTPITTFATLNTTISRVDQFNNITTVHDVANLTLISYFPSMIVANCSQNATDPACPPDVTPPQEECAPANSTETADGGTPANGTLCTPPLVPEATNSTDTDLPAAASGRVGLSEG